MGGMVLCGFASVLEAKSGHALAEAALLEELLFQAAELLVDQVVGLINQAKGDVGYGFWRTSLHKFAVKLICLRGFAANCADKLSFFGILGPNGEVPSAKKIFVIVQQFFEAGSGNVGELDFGFFGGGAGLAAFEDVLFAGASGLDHLIDGTVAFGQKFVREAEG